MSGNICLDPIKYYHAETQTCQWPEISEARSQAIEPTATYSGKTSNPLTSPAKSGRNLEQYRQMLAQGAFEKSPSPTPSLLKQNPLEFGVFSFLVACNSDGSSFPKDQTSSGNGGSPSIPDASTTGEVGGTGNTGGAGGSGGSGGTDNLPNAGNINDGGNFPTIPGAAILHDTAPCGSVASIPDLDEGLGVCTHYSTGPEDPSNFQLFGWDPDLSNSASTLSALAFAPDQVLEGSSGEIFVTTYGDDTAVPKELPGIAVLNASLPGPVQQEPFPNIVLRRSSLISSDAGSLDGGVSEVVPNIPPDPHVTSSGREVDLIAPTFPKGLVEWNHRVFIATSNLDLNNQDFLPGTVLVKNLSTGTWSNFFTTGFNPTGIGLNNDRLYVVNTGAVDFYGVVSSDSSVDIFDPGSQELLENIPLGPVAAGIEGELTFTPDGQTLILATGDNSGRLIVVDLNTKESREIPVATGSKILLSGVTLHPDGEIVYVNNFNDGTLYTVDLKTARVLSSQILDQDVTDLMGLSDSLWKSGALFVGNGPNILKLSTQSPDSGL